MTLNASEDTPTIILAAIDTSDRSEEVLDALVRFGRPLARVEIHLLHVVQPPPGDGGSGILPTVHETCARASELLQRAAARVEERVAGAIISHVAVGEPAREILELAAELCVDLIVVGSERKSTAQRWVLGSVSEKLVRKAPCAVLVARPNEHQVAPAVEAPCADCVELQSHERSERLWCEKHDRSRRHPRAHTHYETPQAFARGAMLLRPEG